MLLCTTISRPESEKISIEISLNFRKLILNQIINRLDSHSSIGTSYQISCKVKDKSGVQQKNNRQKTRVTGQEAQIDRPWSFSLFLGLSDRKIKGECAFWELGPHTFSLLEKRVFLLVYKFARKQWKDLSSILSY